jgi:methionyl-tRNA formyltransferase
MALAPVPPHPRRLVYLGTPGLAVPPLRALVAAGWDVALAVTRVDKRRGRGSDRSPSPVKAAALELGVPVSHRVDDALEAGADLGVVVAFGQLVRPPVLERLPMVNLHFSLLPRWRGAAPVERALLAGDEMTGVCVMQLEEGLDTGPVFARATVPVGPRTTADALRADLVDVGTGLLLGCLAGGFGVPVPQEGEPTYAAKLEPAELQLMWGRPAAELDRLVRLGGAWTTFRGRRLRVLDALPAAGGLAPGVLEGDRVGTGEGDLVLLTVQPEGKAAMPVTAWRNGARPLPGEVLGG